MSRPRVNGDFGISVSSIITTLCEAQGAILEKEGKKAENLAIRLGMVTAILKEALPAHYPGDYYAIDYELTSALGNKSRHGYIATDYNDLQRCAILEQKGDCKILSINGVEWDADDFEYYFPERGQYSRKRDTKGETK